MKKLNLSENTSVGLPLKNLLSLIGAIIVGSYFAFGVLERLNNLETADILFKEDLLKRAEQEPKNLELFMLIEHLAGQIESILFSIEKEIEASRYNKVNIDHLKEQVDNINKQIEKLRNGNH
jgi:peptidoglycan hydrolase CwlO-like protein